MKGRLWSAYFAGTTSMLAIFFVVIQRPMEGFGFVLFALSLMMVAFLEHTGTNDDSKEQK